MSFNTCWLLHSLYLHFHRLPGALREGFNKDNRFRLSVSSSLTLHYVWLIISVFSPICCRSNFLWHWLSKVLICEYSKMSLGLILLLLLSFGLVLFGFMLGLLLIQSQVSELGMGSFLWTSQILIGYSYKHSDTIALVYFASGASL